MSAIGKYVRMRTADLDRCLELASRATPDRPFRWPWQTKAESTQETFHREWASAVLEEVVFDGSGHVLSSYFLAQEEVNGVDDPFASAEAAALGRVFTAAFAARAALRLPELSDQALRQFCESEWDDEGPEMHQAIAAAHVFVKAGMARIRSDEAVVFIVS